MAVEQEVADKVAKREEVLAEQIRAHLGVTDGGKDIYLIRKPNCSVRVIAFGDGGQLPDCLGGGYSSVSAAQGMVDSYLAKVKFEKENKKPAAKRTGRGK